MAQEPAGNASAAASPYGTLPPASPMATRKPISLPRIQEMHTRGEKITMVTAYDATAARLVGAGGAVHSFEANRATHGLLQDNLALNACGNVTAHWLAVGESEGLARIAPREAGNAGADGVELANAGDDTVRLVRLDQVLAGVPLRLVKLDIEGWEAKALRGAEGLLARAEAPDLVFEFTPEFLHAAGDDPRDLIGWIAGLGYRVQVVDKAGMHAPDDALYSRRQSYLYCSRG